MNIDMAGKTLLITGGTGTLGQAFVRSLLTANALSLRRIIVFSRDEYKQSVMMGDIADPDRKLRFFVGDVRDRARLCRAFAGVDYVIHAAAMKQVPACEYNPFEAVKTNIQGTQNVIDAAIDADVECVIGVSTDKAVQPLNLYGSTKLCAEKLLIAANAYAQQTRFAVVRYGNAINSRGSVIEVFRQQRKTGTITITDPRMTRFWLPVQSAVDAIIYALEQMCGGEIYVPRAPSLNIVDLAQAIAPDCKHKIIGIRPGEKLHETLITAEEATRTVAQDNYYVIYPEVNSDDRQSCWAGPTIKGNLPAGFQYASNSNPQKLKLQKEDLQQC